MNIIKWRGVLNQNPYLSSYKILNLIIINSNSSLILDTYSYIYFSYTEKKRLRIDKINYQC